MKILVTGSAGFVGFHVAKALLQRGDAVVGFDVVNSYYDPTLKEARLRILEQTAKERNVAYRFIRANLADTAEVDACFAEHRFDRVIHLAAQAGVRHSIDHPHDYVQSNLVAFTNILEACQAQRHAAPDLRLNLKRLRRQHANALLGAPRGQSSAAILRRNQTRKRADGARLQPYVPAAHDGTAVLYRLWSLGRPDMALFQFTKNILEGKPITVFNYGKHTRDFTYIDDIAEGVILVSDKIAEPDSAWQADAPDPATSNAPFRIFNIGNNSPVTLEAYIEAIEQVLGRKAERELLPLQKGDVPDTYADVSELAAAVNYKPATPVATGVARFVQWYRDYYGV